MKQAIRQCLCMFTTIGFAISTPSWTGDDLSLKDCDADSEDAWSFVASVRHGHFSRARFLAQQILLRQPSPTACEKSIRKLYIFEADRYLSNLLDWQTALKSAKEEGDQPRLVATVDAEDCWTWDLSQEDEFLDIDLWSQCCSQLPQPAVKTKDTTETFGSHDEMDGCLRNGSQRSLCCDFCQGTSCYLHLPLIEELSLRLRVQTDEGSIISFDLEQDGLLRRFDPAAVLWPTAYLLSLCLAGPRQCGIPEIYDAAAAAHLANNTTVALELGTGIGAPAIALSRTLRQQHRDDHHDEPMTGQPLVMATDKSRSALALTLSNARAAQVSGLLSVDELDFSDLAALQEFRDLHGGFAIVLGSSLMSLFDPDNPEPLWQVLNILLDEKNPHAVAILAYSVHSVRPEAGLGFRLARRISGDHFGMHTRQGDSSDFEISIYSRQASIRQDEL